MGMLGHVSQINTQTISIYIFCSIKENKYSPDDALIVQSVYL